MSSLSSVKIQQAGAKYTWSQSEEAISIQVPLRNVLMKHVDIFYSDLLVKVSAQQVKFFLALDLMHEIEHRHAKNRAQLLDGRLELYLMKK